MDREWSSAIFKESVSGPVKVTRTGLDGDGQEDLNVHGGPDKAINVYASEHFPAWRTEPGLGQMEAGAFGENLTLEGALETELCIGDIFQLGEIQVQVSQPRQPCWKLARRWRMKDLPARVVANGKTGWYFRVIQEGTVEAGSELTLLDRPHPDWTIAAATNLLYHRKDDVEGARSLAGCEALSASWKEQLAGRFGD